MHFSGIYVHRIALNAHPEERIEKRTLPAAATVEDPAPRPRKRPRKTSRQSPKRQTRRMQDPDRGLNLRSDGVTRRRGAAGRLLSQPRHRPADARRQPRAGRDRLWLQSENGMLVIPLASGKASVVGDAATPSVSICASDKHAFPLSAPPAQRSVLISKVDAQAVVLDTMPSACPSSASQASRTLAFRNCCLAGAR